MAVGRFVVVSKFNQAKESEMFAYVVTSLGTPTASTVVQEEDVVNEK